VPVPADVVCPAKPGRGERSGGVGRLSKPAAWLVPDVSLVAALATLLYCFTLFNGLQKLFRDSDSGWHIRTGESILASGSLPHSDPYSFTRAGQPWLAWEWGSDVLIGGVHRVGGLPAVAMLYGAAIAACTWLWFRLHWAVGGNFLLACAMAAPMLSTANLHWLARPHLLSWLFVLGAVWCAERVSWRWRSCLWVALGTALWANLHASFLFAPALPLLYAGAHFLRPWIWEMNSAAEREKARWFLLAAASALGGSLLNPYGWNLHLHVFRYLGDSELLGRIGEFQSFNFHAEGATQILLALGIAAVGAVLALGQKRLAQFLLSAALIVMALRSARGLPLVALVGLPLANGAITEGLRACRNLRPRLRSWLDGFLDYSEGLRRLDAGLDGRAVALAVVLLALLWIRTPAVAARTGFPLDQFPVKAAGAIEKLPQGIRLLAPDKYGGYLIYRFQGKRKVFFDGRSDFYGAEYMKRYVRLMQVRPGWREQLQAVGFTHALLPNDYSLVAALEQAGWKRLYRDELATLLERPRG